LGNTRQSEFLSKEEVDIFVKLEDHHPIGLKSLTGDWYEIGI
jgi:hypothetical protein